jgi:hypothetical protein
MHRHTCLCTVKAYAVSHRHVCTDLLLPEDSPVDEHAKANTFIPPSLAWWC